MYGQQLTGRGWLTIEANALGHGLLINPINSTGYYLIIILLLIYYMCRFSEICQYEFDFNLFLKKLIVSVWLW